LLYFINFTDFCINVRNLKEISECLKSRHGFLTNQKFDLANFSVHAQELAKSSWHYKDLNKSCAKELLRGRR